MQKIINKINIKKENKEIREGRLGENTEAQTSDNGLVSTIYKQLLKSESVRHSVVSNSF